MTSISPSLPQSKMLDEDPLAPIKKKLATMLKARFPYCAVQTWDEDRTVSLVKQLVQDTTLIKTTRVLYIWDSHSGFYNASGSPVADTKTPLSAVEFMLSCQGASVFLIKDAVTFFPVESRDIDWILLRRLKHLSEKLRYGSDLQNVLFIGENITLPESIAKEVHLMSIGLPNVDEMKLLLTSMMAENLRPDQISLSPDDCEQLAKAALGLTLKEAENAFAFAMVSDSKLDIHDIQWILEEKYRSVRQGDVLEFIESKQKIDEVGGLENLKLWLQKRKNSWLSGASKYGLPSPKGVLITGVPGCGKSMVCKAIGSLWDLPVIRLDAGRLYSSLMGSSEQNLRRAIQTAEAIAPCILWIDELEKGFSQSASDVADGGTSNRILGTLLTWMQEKTASVFIAATSNNINKLPPELLRKGRFDEIFFVDLPRSAERAQILMYHLKKRLKDPSVVGDFKLTQDVLVPMVNAMKGFNGSEIEQVVINGLFEAFSENRSLTVNDIETAIKRIVPLSQTQAEEIYNMRAWSQNRAVQATSEIPYSSELQKTKQP